MSIKEMLAGAKALAMTVVDLLSSPEIVSKAEKEFPAAKKSKEIR